MEFVILSVYEKIVKQANHYKVYALTYSKPDYLMIK